MQVVVVQTRSFGHFQYLGQCLSSGNQNGTSVADGASVHLQACAQLVGLVVYDEVEPGILVDGRVVAQVKRHVSRFAAGYILDKCIFHGNFRYFHLQCFFTDDRSGLVILGHDFVFIRAGGGSSTCAEDESRQVQVFGIDVTGSYIFIFTAWFLIYVYREIVVAAVGQYETYHGSGFFLARTFFSLRSAQTFVDFQHETGTQCVKFHVGGKSADDHREAVSRVGHVGIAAAVFHRGTGLHREVLDQFAVFNGLHFGALVVFQTGNPIVHRLVQRVDGVRTLSVFCREIDFVARSVEESSSILIIVGGIFEHFVGIAATVVFIIRTQQRYIDRFAGGVGFGLEAGFRHFVFTVEEAVTQCLQFRNQSRFDVILRIGKQRGKRGSGFQRSGFHQCVTGAFYIYNIIWFILAGLLRSFKLSFVYQCDGIGRTIRKVGAITQEHVAHGAYIVFVIAGAELCSSGGYGSLGVRVAPLFGVLYAHFARVGLLYGLYRTHTDTGKGHQFITHIRSHGFFTFLCQRTVVGGAFRKGGSLFQIRVGVAARGVAEYGQQFVRSGCHEVAALADRTLHDDLIALLVERTGPVDGRGIVLVAHRGLYVDVGAGSGQIHLRGHERPVSHTRRVGHHAFHVVGTVHRGLE